MPTKASQEYSPIQLSPWQKRVVGCVQAVDTLNSVLLSGGRGGGKSILLVFLIIYFSIINGKGHRGVLIRTDLAGLQKLESLLYDHIPKMLPGSKYYKAKRLWRMSNGASLMLIHQSDASSFNKLQGEDISHCYIDELTQFPDPQTVLRIRSSMRTSDPSVQLKFIAKAKDDQSIQEKLKAAKTPEDVVDIAKEHGHEFTQDHMTQLSEE